jgi:hypothetical protein
MNECNFLTNPGAWSVAKTMMAIAGVQHTYDVTSRGGSHTPTWPSAHFARPMLGKSVSGVHQAHSQQTATRACDALRTRRIFPFAAGAFHPCGGGVEIPILHSHHVESWPRPSTRHTPASGLYIRYLRTPSTHLPLGSLDLRAC